MQKTLHEVVTTVQDAKGALLGLAEDLQTKETSPELIQYAVNILNSVVDDLS